MTNHEGVEIEAGDWVVSGEGSERDYGQVEADAAGNMSVCWHGPGAYVRTPIDNGDRVDVYTDRMSAEEAFRG